MFVVIPAYNAGATVEKVFARIPAQVRERVRRYVVVNDGSIDDTETALERLRTLLIKAGDVSRIGIEGLRDDRAAVLPGGLAIMSAVLAERRNRDQARLTAVPPEAVAAWRPPAGGAIQEPTAAAREGEAPGNEPPAVGGFVPPV